MAAGRVGAAAALAMGLCFVGGIAEVTSLRVDGSICASLVNPPRGLEARARCSRAHAQCVSKFPSSSPPVPPMPLPPMPLPPSPVGPQTPQGTQTALEAPPSHLEFVLAGGETMQITIRTDADIVSAAAAIAARYPDVSATDVERELRVGWEASKASRVAAYSGPSVVGDGGLCGVRASFELDEVGLVIEVADSLVAAGAGAGLFLRLMDGAEAVTLAAGTAMCGYAAGRMAVDAQTEGGKTVAFCLRTPSTSVWFERELHSVGELLMREDVESIAGHIGVLDEAGTDVVAVHLDPEYTGPRYFIPEVDQPPLAITNIGCLANDLAIGQAWLKHKASTCAPTSEPESTSKSPEHTPTAENQTEYSARSSDANVLVLVQRLERDAERPSLLVPSRPITTLARTVSFTNSEPMEIGCRYGEEYWGLAEQSQVA